MKTPQNHQLQKDRSVRFWSKSRARLSETVKARQRRLPNNNYTVAAAFLLACQNFRRTAKNIFVAVTFASLCRWENLCLRHTVHVCRSDNRCEALKRYFHSLQQCTNIVSQLRWLGGWMHHCQPTAKLGEATEADVAACHMTPGWWGRLVVLPLVQWPVHKRVVERCIMKWGRIAATLGRHWTGSPTDRLVEVGEPD